MRDHASRGSMTRSSHVLWRRFPTLRRQIYSTRRGNRSDIMAGRTRAQMHHGKQRTHGRDGSAVPEWAARSAARVASRGSPLPGASRRSHVARTSGAAAPTTSLLVRWTASKPLNAWVATSSPAWLCEDADILRGASGAAVWLA